METIRLGGALIVVVVVLLLVFVVLLLVLVTFGVWLMASDHKPAKRFWGGLVYVGGALALIKVGLLWILYGLNTRTDSTAAYFISVMLAPLLYPVLSPELSLMPVGFRMNSSTVLVATALLIAGSLMWVILLWAVIEGVRLLCKGIIGPG